MNSISITTSQNIELEYELAGLGERIVGSIIDFVLLVSYLIVFSILFNIGAFSSMLRHNGWLIFFISLPLIFYDLVCEILFNGQTLGKKIMKIKVISLDGRQPTWGQYILRWLFRLVDFILTWNICAILCIAVSEKKQRVGDMVAGTTLIRTSPRTVFQQTIYTPTPDLNYTVSFPEVTGLSDSDIQLIREVILHIQRTGNLYLAYPTAEKVKTLLGVQTNLEASHFLHVVIADYNHLTSKG
jgi:uncharacterized RDD family membrane protein YckC